jgi:8-amino-3,8-dideoxy-alpha-D-manno-octulosonate transaminase
MTMDESINRHSRLAVDGGEPVVRTPLPPMYPGGMRIGAEEEAAVLEVLRSKRLFRYYGPQEGPSKVAALEQRFSEISGAQFALAVTSGTAALVSSLAALGVGPGDEVIVPAYTWIASAEAVMGAGAVPVVAEVDESLTLDAADVEQRLTSRTRAIIPVHMRGAPCNMDALLSLANTHQLPLVEDAAQACGASYRGRRLGSIGTLGAFSFQFNKIVTAGEGGMLITSDEKLYRRAAMVHDVVGGQRNHVPPAEIIPGLNFRMSELQGAVMLVQLERMEGLLRDMRRNKAQLKGALEGIARQKGVTFRQVHDAEGEAALALILFTPDVGQAEKVKDALNAEGAPASILYHPERVDYHIYPHWEPVINRSTWSAAGGPWRWHTGTLDYSPRACPRSLDLLSRAIHLDISPDLTGENIEELAEAVYKVFSALL